MVERIKGVKRILIYDQAVLIRAKKSTRSTVGQSGKAKGEWEHKFSHGDQIFGLADGSLLIKNKFGKRLFETRDEKEYKL